MHLIQHLSFFQLKMIKSFFEYIKEDNNITQDSWKIVDDILAILSKNDHQNSSYDEIGVLEYTEYPKVDIRIEARYDSSPDFKSDEHFKNLQWEELNFKKNGFSIDANTQIDDKNFVVPNIIITILLNPNVDYLNELRLRLYDIINHELDHSMQTGMNDNPFKANPSDEKLRKESKNNYRYFLLPEEIESMVDGIYERSKEEEIDINILFDKYLMPFVKSGKISNEQYDEIFKKWMIYALEKYPDVDISLNDNRVSKIVNFL